jgi:uncharacterized protein (TIGR00730 family)
MSHGYTPIPTPTPFRASSATPLGTEDEQLLQQVPSPKEREEAVRVSDSWRIFRVMGEFVWGFDNLADVRDGVSIFGSARTKPEDPYYQQARETARLLALQGIPVITGGGPGIMEAGNMGAAEAGGLSIGCNIELPFEQRGNEYANRALYFKFFFVRKTMFVKYSTAFIVFPGGYGTLDELFEALTLIQTGKVSNFPVVLFGRSYWQDMVNWLRKTAVGGGNINLSDLDLFHLSDDPAEAVKIVLDARARNASGKP